MRGGQPKRPDWRVKHGLTKSREYRTWIDMRSRCTNRANRFWARYGGRGIRVCERWDKSFESFFEDMGPRPSPLHSLERLNNDGNYEPGNVIWGTRTQQHNNKCTNVMVTYGGVTQTLMQWSKQLGIGFKTLEFRVKNWPIEDAMTRPVAKRNWTRSPGRLKRKENTNG